MTWPNCPVRGYLVGLQHRATSPAPLRLAAQSVPPSSHSPLAQCGLFTPLCDAQLGYFKDISEPGSRGLTQLSRPGWTLQSQIESASPLLPAWRHDSKSPILLMQTFFWDQQRPSILPAQSPNGRRYSCPQHLSRTGGGACRDSDARRIQSHGRRHLVCVCYCAASQPPGAPLHPVPSRILLATQGGAASRPHCQTLASAPIEGRPCAKVSTCQQMPPHHHNLLLQAAIKKHPTSPPYAARQFHATVNSFTMRIFPLAQTRCMLTVGTRPNSAIPLL